jgi:hypothetical protein
MDVKLNEAELKAAIGDWLKKQMPELLPDGQPKISGIVVQGYPPNATVSLQFTLTAPAA